MVKRSAGPAREQTQRMVIRLSAPRFVRLSDPERPGEVASSIEVISSPYAMDFRSRRARLYGVGTDFCQGRLEIAERRFSDAVTTLQEALKVDQGLPARIMLWESF
jgi:hypothetical protein